MKRTVLLPLACLLLALRTVAQAPEKAAPDDLVVTAEIVDHEYTLVDRRYSSRRSLNGEPGLVLGIKMTVRNTTNHERAITVMNCSWSWLWAAKGAYFVCGPSGCDANYPYSIIIPPRQAVDFYDELCTDTPAQSADSIRVFQLGFTDIPLQQFNQKPSKKQQLFKPVIYWSNTISDDVRPTATAELKKNIAMRWVEVRSSY